MWLRLGMRRRRVVGAATGVWMKGQLSKMGELNQKVISASMGR